MLNFIKWYFFLHFLRMYWIKWVDFQILNHPCLSEVNDIRSWCIILFTNHLICKINLLTLCLGFGHLSSKEELTCNFSFLSHLSTTRLCWSCKINWKVFLLLFFILWKNVCNIDTISHLNTWNNSPGKLYVPRHFFLGRF